MGLKFREHCAKGAAEEVVDQHSEYLEYLESSRIILKFIELTLDGGLTFGRGHHRVVC